MTILAQLTTSLALLLLVLVGFLTMVGATTLRDRVLKILGGVLVLVIFLPTLLAISVRAFQDAVDGASLDDHLDLPSGLVPAAVLGHVVLAVALLRRRFGAEALRRREAERERARVRERVRLPAGLDEEEE